MSIFNTDMPRNFAIGFFVGVLIVAFQISPELGSQVLPEAVATTFS
ncbi:hypothetical protein QWY75_11365 [Pontixanthobacter aestiaquae]|uniref:Uncharacterized protein n=1 Tax=Pontixanthobacter aestiaquae TaxID=1509367 RepID=A0A844Z3B1_9SPHN|nr:hypothetical protein [Pontixanthobacter aestiaquae]MDN3646800.1 hypothetical protein [Pontixanthobacter aestiaquae]MXO82218.1 hypothetical protein [Pontixanthobacter aestiaquae]